MAWHDADHVITCDGIVIWEAVTKPDVSDKDQSLTWNLRIAVNPNAPEVGELRQLHEKALRESKKPNVNLQRPGNNPIGQIDAPKFPEIDPSWLVFSAGTKQGAPTVMSADGHELQPMTYGPQLYNGTIVRLLVHAYAYDNVQKGVNFGLDGVQIINSQAPRLSIGAAGMSKDAVKAAFGAVSGGSQQPPAQQQQQTPPPPPQQQQSHQPPPPPHTGYMGGDQQQPPPPPPAAVFPPAGWWPHPAAPGSFYNAQNEVLTEALLRARVGA